MKRWIVLLSLVPFAAFAGNPHDNKDPSTEQSQAQAQSQEQAQLQGQSQQAVGLGVGLGVGVGQGGDATAYGGKANATALGVGGSSESTSGAAVVGSGNSHNAQGQSLNYSDESDFLSLAFPGATADPGTTAHCTESRRGWSFFGAGASGRTRINERCYEDAKASLDDAREFSQCMMIADKLFAVGAVQAGLAQLNRCNGPIDVSLATSEIRQAREASSSERLHRMFEAAQSK